jgi:frataxin-like iron-binding protein CyaY
MYIGGPFGVLLDGDTKSMSTASCPIPSQPTNVSVDSVDGRTCIVKFAWPTDGSATEIDISLTNTSPYDDKGFTQIADITSFGVSLPNYNTVYTLYVRSYNSTWGTWSSPVSVTLTTGKPPTPSISFINKASNSITMQITAPSDRTSRLEMHMYIKGNGSPTEVQSVDTPTANQSYQFIFSNLTYGVIYVFYGQNFDYNADGITLVGSTYTTGISFLRPENFAWTTAKVKGQHFDLTDDEWNALTARINEFRTYKGLTNNTFVSAVTGNKLTAVMFNQVVNAINAMFPPTSPPSTVADPQPTDFSLRDKVTADRLNGLVTSLNSII